MSQAGFTPIQIYHSTTAASIPAPANLKTGELGLNVVDKRLFTKDGGGAVVEVGINPSSLTVPTISAPSAASLVYKSGVDFVWFKADGVTELMRLKQGGNLGVGIDTPIFKLDVKGPANAGIRYADGTVATVIGTGNATNGFVGTTTNHPLVIAANGGPVIYAVATGDAGINDAAPKHAGIDRAFSINGSGNVIIDLKTNNDLKSYWYADSSITTIGSPVQPLSFYVAGPNRLYLAANGSVGIGTDTPVARLDVEGGDFLLRGGSVNIGPTAGANGAARISTLLSSGVAGLLMFSTGDVSAMMQERMRIDYEGKVGIGTTAAQSILNVKKDIYTTGAPSTTAAIVLSNRDLSGPGGGSSIAGGIFSDTFRDVVGDRHFTAGIWFNKSNDAGVTTSGSIHFGTQASNSADTLPTERMVIAPYGQIGIGVASPDAVLQLGYRGSSLAFGSGDHPASVGEMIGEILFSPRNVVADGWRSSIRSYVPAGSGGIDFTDLRFYTTYGSQQVNQERLRITANGDLNFQAGSPFGTPGGMTIGTLSSGGIVLYQGQFNSPADQTYTSYIYNGTQIGRIIQSGTTTVLYLGSSDYRLKEEIEDLQGSGAFIDALRPRKFRWKATGELSAGFLAHEFAEVSPRSVAGEKDAVDEDGKPKIQGMQASSSEVMANVIAELKSLRLRVASLPLLDSAVKELSTQLTNANAQVQTLTTMLDAAMARFQTLESDVAVLRNRP